MQHGYHTKLPTVRQITRSHPRLPVMLWMSRDKATMGFVDLHEILEESLDSLRRRTTTDDAADALGFDEALLVVHSELACLSLIIMT